MERDQRLIGQLRELHGVLERALQLAAKSAAESHATSPDKRIRDLTEGEWFQAFVHEGAKEMQGHGRFAGRWSLFTDDEIRSLSAARDLWDGVLTEEHHVLFDEVKLEAERRFPAAVPRNPETS